MSIDRDAHGTTVWLTFPSQINDADLLARYVGLLDAGEQLQLGRFRFQRDRTRYLVTRSAVRTILADLLGCAAAALRFAPTAYGKPLLVDAPAAASGLSFNVSHTKDLIVVATARGVCIGIDVENTVARRAPLEIADRYFAPEEVRALRALPAREQDAAFFRYWTLKEAYIKARGLGLSIPLETFSFTWKDNVRCIDFQAPDDDARPEWTFRQCQIADSFMLALCTDRQINAGDPVRFRRYLPLVGNVDADALVSELGRTRTTFR